MHSAQTTNSYKDLIVYKKTTESAVTLFIFYKSQKLIWLERFVIQQLLRAVTSVGANIAEGYGRQYKKDYRRFLSIARGSSYETEHWINLLKVLRPQDRDMLDNTENKNVEVIKILSKLMKNLES